MARALFFGRLRDAAGCAERTISLDQVVDIAAFRRLIADGDEHLEAVLGEPHVRVAVNAALTPRASSCMVAPHDEVAFMPPFSGG